MTSVPPRLPEFPASLRWLERPPCSVATGLRGHVVGLLLWRLGCVHSRQALAELGFIVVELDGMGTPGRSKAFHDFYYGRMGDNTIPDQVAGMQELARDYQQRRNHYQIGDIGWFE